MTIYTSPYPPTPLPKISLFSHIFPPNDPHADSPAFIDATTDTLITRKQLQADARILAFGLRNGLEHLGAINVSRFTTILVFSPNSISIPLLILAALAGGIRISLASSAYTPSELATNIDDSKPTHIFVHPSLLDTALAALKILNVDSYHLKRRLFLLSPADQIPSDPRFKAWFNLDDIMRDRKQITPENFDGEEAHRTAILFYSSGTTGRPKGVELTHYNITSVLTGLRNSARYSEQPGKDVTVGVIPYFHVYGGVMLLFYPLVAAVPSIVLPKFEPESFLGAIEKYKATTCFIAPPIAVFLANSPLLDRYNLTSLKSLTSSAASLSPSLTERVQKRLWAAGAEKAHLNQGFGITELSPAVCDMPYGRFDKPAASGLLLPNLEARLVGEDGKDVKEGERGELWVRGPTVMKGYWNRPQATKEVIEDGWFKTGDIATRDEEGFFSIVDRKKELIKYKGFQVSPAEVEDVLLAHPQILDAAVIGVLDPKTDNELPRAYIVPRDPKLFKKGAKFSPDVRLWVKERLSHYKQLRGGVVVLKEIPKSASGKILRRELQALAKSESSGLRSRL